MPTKCNPIHLQVSNIYATASHIQHNPIKFYLTLCDVEQVFIDQLDCSSDRGLRHGQYSMHTGCRVFSPSGHLVLPLWIDEEANHAHYSDMEDGSLFTVSETMPSTGLITTTIWKKCGKHALQHSIGNEWLNSMLVKVVLNYNINTTNATTMSPIEVLNTVHSGYTTRQRRNHCAVNDLIETLLPKSSEITSFNQTITTTTNIMGMPLPSVIEEETDYDPNMSLKLSTMRVFDRIRRDLDPSNFVLIIEDHEGWHYPKTKEEKLALLQADGITRAFIMYVIDDRRGVGSVINVVFFPGDDIDSLDEFSKHVNFIVAPHVHLSTHKKSIAYLLAHGTQKLQPNININRGIIALTGFSLTDAGYDSLQLSGVTIAVWPVYVITDSRVVFPK